MTALSVVIVTFNPGELVLECLRSLPGNVAGEPLEVIVVDNASQDGTPSRIEGEFPHVRLIANQSNGGFAAANNQGLRLARGQYLLLLNPDVVVHPGALESMVAYMEASPQVGIVGPRTFDGMGQVALTARPEFTPLSILWQYLQLHRLFPNRVTGRYRRAALASQHPFEVSWVQASCLMLRRAVYEEIGGLDEGFFLFAEEPDLCERARSQGWEVVYLPSAEVTHYESSTTSRYAPQKIRCHHISPLYYFRKRDQKGPIRVLKVGFTIELIVKLAIRLAEAIVRHDSERLGRVVVYWNVLGEVWRY